MELQDLSSIFEKKHLALNNIRQSRYESLIFFLCRLYKKKISFYFIFSGESLQICPQGPTCCTPDMEHRLGQWFSSQFKEAVNNKSLEISKPFQAKATKIFGKIDYF